MKNPIYAGVDLKTRQSERKLRFIEAGIQLMGRTGYRSATVRALCAEAGLTERYFYQSFQNTEALLIAVINHLTGNFMKRLTPFLNAQTSDSDQQNLAR
ncbi:MAG: TetR/AcrR family transcriptional regulator, partial [Moraxellaceae bacterium]